MSRSRSCHELYNAAGLPKAAAPVAFGLEKPLLAGYEVSGVTQKIITKCDGIITNCDSLVYYKTRWTLQIAIALLLQSATGITKCDDYYKLRQYTWW